MLLFCATRGLVGHEKLKGGWYAVINTYQFTVFEIWRDFDFFVLSHIACPCYPYIRVYRLYDIDWFRPITCCSVLVRLYGALRYVKNWVQSIYVIRRVHGNNYIVCGES